MIYISGPITGQSKLDHFFYAETILKLKGWKTFNPVKRAWRYCYKNKIKDLPYEKWIDLDLKALEKCSAIFMLKGWQDSRGCLIEYSRATELKLEFYFEENGYLET